MFKKIINPVTMKEYSVNSEEGKQILKQLVKSFNKGGIKDRFTDDSFPCCKYMKNKKNKDRCEKKLFRPYNIIGNWKYDDCLVAHRYKDRKPIDFTSLY